MRVFRPVRFADLPDIEHLAVAAGGNMTTLPNNRDHLEQLINTTQQSLQQNVVSATDQSYHFVIEETTNRKILGISGIEACVGFSSPFYSYRCEQLQHHSQTLQISNTIDTLNLSQDCEGLSRLCTFYLAPTESMTSALPLLSLSRLMFVGQQRHRFGKKLMLELQGMVDTEQRSPFWQSLGKHFFNMEFQRANYLTGINAKGFIADLMPKYPVYVPLLDKTAQQAIGQLRPDLLNVKKLFTSEGFVQNNYISIFDGGPTLEASTASLKTVNTQFSCNARIQDTVDSSTKQAVLISNNYVKNFAALHTLVDLSDIYLTPEQAQQLNVAVGDKLFVLPLDINQNTLAPETIL